MWKPESVKATLTMNFAGVSMPLSKQAQPSESTVSFNGGVDNQVFYKDLKAQSDLLPKKEDFVAAPFRLLSASVVGANSWKSTDFSDEEMLRGSMQKLVGKTVYLDHAQNVSNWVGIIESVSWSEERTENGEYIPAGINGVLLIDGKTSPKIARGLLLGAIYSNSVTVDFNWSPSHEFDTEEEFMANVGQMGEDGKMVTRVARVINDYYETSLVWLGADPFSKLIGKDGNLKNVDKHHVYLPFSKEGGECKEYSEKKNYNLSFCLNKNVLYLAKEIFKSEEKLDLKMDNFIAGFEKELGIKEDNLRELLNVEKGTELNKAHFESYFKKVNELNAEQKTKLEFAEKVVAIDGLKDELKDKDLASFSLEGLKVINTNDIEKLEKAAETAENEVKELNIKVGELAKQAKIGNDFVNLKREETKRLYKLSSPTSSDAVLKLIDGAEPAALEGLLEQYTKTSANKFSGTCKKCGSSEFEFRSTVSSSDEEVVKEVSTSTFNDLYEKHNARSMNIGKKYN